MNEHKDAFQYNTESRKLTHLAVGNCQNYDW